ncbi:MAG: FAD:protein FMN transferase [Acholeplasmataceae bacterium]|jgi:thiamine biosynthesis lipoprotein|nr:FAD:protein FMN transferase [Acholeplasmataceae bacterium]
MKRIFSIFMLFLLVIFLVACKDQDNPKNEYVHNFSFDNYMYTLIRISITAESKEKALELEEEIENIYSMYHDLTSNQSHDALDDDSPYLENLYSINNQKNIQLEIDKELYDMISYSLDLKAVTNGYFDISIGKVVDAWKALIVPEESPEIGDDVFLIEDEVYKKVTAINYDTGRISVEDYTKTFSFFDYKRDITTEAFNLTINHVEQIDFSDFEIDLFEEDEKYYIRIDGDDIKLDLGAISKGYATQKVHDLLKENGVEYFSISAGSSSIVVGKNANRENDEFWISLANPIETSTSTPEYGTFYMKDNSITTSGNYEQYIIYQGQRYHHIVSPKTKQPAHFYHTVTLIGENAGLLDALSTALFSMSPTELETWIDQYQDVYNIDVITYNQDRTISKYLIRDIREDF